MRRKLNSTTKQFASLMVVLLLFLCTVVPAFAIDGVFHDPYGLEDRYVIEVDDRYPQDPVAGEDVYIKLTTWPIEPGQAVWITWEKNGVPQSVINGSFEYNDGNNTYWEIA